MKAGDIVYNSKAFPVTREELVEFLCDAIEATLGIYQSDRLSDGFVADTLLRFLDEAVTTEEQIAALKEFLDDAER